ncbi:bile acid:sodium symporter family protein [Sphingomonas montanisoli]|uniref:Bile acid:sodium symporter n=1 Tax=Sphingomonas montanisoli TaxID=2606412 RepID=A0A5D9BZ42_9SPHN|nr:bile acid:sodium symporter family protein [Sphingomonas montanisoli]TZG24177.1 bile acid:sodium symporter [Sphingomonas montanisoli]
MRLILQTLKRVDPFLLMLIATIVAASLLPARGAGVSVFHWLANAAIVLLFFLHGAKLSRAAIVAGVGNWRLHLLVMASSFVLFPILGLGLSIFARPMASPEILAGLLFLSLLPSTVQSSIAFTAMAGGNVPAAVCSASLSNLTGIVITPLLVALLMNVGGAGHEVSIDAVGDIVVQLLLPFVSGHLLRPWIGGWVDSHKKLLQPVDRSSILLVVYTAFSAAVVQGIWQKVSPLDLVTILALSAILLALVMGVNILMARRAGLPREDAIVLLFCGSKKSLVSGVPMAGALFAPAVVGVLILPLMIFHQLQLFVCAVIAGRYRAELEPGDA